MTAIGPAGDAWQFTPGSGYDLARGAARRLSLATRTVPITVDPARTALVVIDMQNFFLAPALGRPADSAGLAAAEVLLYSTLPAARRAGIRVVWMNWALTDDSLARMPAAVLKAFGAGQAPPGKSERLYVGLGGDLGSVALDGREVEAGRMLVAGEWNARLYAPLEREWLRGREKGDRWVGKDRMSGLWRDDAEGCRVLEELGVRTLLFAGVNTDQCVGGTLQDAFARGFDCVLVRDACGTSSPASAREGIEYNCEKTWGFVIDSPQLAAGVRAME